MTLAAVVPAAGLGRRMGGPKLTLDLAGRSSIERVVSALVGGGIDPVVVVVPPDGDPDLRRLATGAGARVVRCPAPTADMRGTVEVGLGWLARWGVGPLGLMLCPADSPGILAEHVRAVRLAFVADPSRIVIPTHGETRGHPVVFPWSLAVSIPALPPEVGVNALRERHGDRVTFVPIGDPGIVGDLDTPEDVLAWRRKLGARGGEA